VDHSGAAPAVGALLTTKTATFTIPYRPSWDDVDCTAAGQTPETYQPFGGKWYDPVQGMCVTGYAFLLAFDFTADALVLPDEVIYGIAYNTSHYGSSPIGVTGDYDSLNVSVGPNGPTVGTTEVADAFLDSTWGGNYCTGGTGGTGTFRLDAGCWTGYVPVARFNTVSPVCDGRPATLVGTPGDDVLKGTPGDDVIMGDEGDDVIRAGGGNDVVCAGPGNDKVFGRLGADLMYGEEGNDRLRGGPGDADDTMYGGEGNDWFRSLRGDDATFGGDGLDSVGYLGSTQQGYVNLAMGSPPPARASTRSTPSSGWRAAPSPTRCAAAPARTSSAGWAATTTCSAASATTSCSGGPVTTSSTGSRIGTCSMAASAPTPASTGKRSSAADETSDPAGAGALRGARPRRAR
jgi:hypothetical protein